MRRRAADLLLALAAGLLLLGPLLGSGRGADGGRDWDYFQADALHARRALLAGELPLWMPFRQGGHDAWADPQSLLASPAFVLVLALGEDLGFRVFLAAAGALGALGALALARRLGLSRPSGALLALLLVLSPRFALACAGGLPTYAWHLALLPWLARAGLGDGPRAALVTGGLLALLLLGGEINYFVWSAVFVGWLALARTALERRAAPLLGLALAALATVGLSAPKLVPLALLVREHPRHVDDRGRGAFTPALLGHALLDREAGACLERPWGELVAVTEAGVLVSLPAYTGPRDDLEIARSAVSWVNAGAYAGVLALGLAVVGVVAGARDPAQRRRPGPLAALALATAPFLLLAQGKNAPGWELVRERAVFRSMRSPDRTIVFPWFALTALAAAGSEALLRPLRARRGPLAARLWGGALVLVVAADVVPPARDVLRRSFVEPRSAPPPAASFAQVALRPDPPGTTTRYGPPALAAVRAGLGAVNAYGLSWVTPAAIPRGASAYAGEASLVAGRGRVVAPPRVGARDLEVEVEVAAADVLVLNHNWAPGWSVQAPAGAAATRHADGRIAVGLGPGTQRVRLVYTPPGLGLGCALLLLALPAGAWAWRRYPPPPEGAAATSA